MTAPTLDPFVAALAAILALFTAYGSLVAATDLSGSRDLACPIGVNALALGLGLWASCTLEAIALTRDPVSLAGLVLPFALACAGMLCTLLFIAGRKPDAPALTGSAFSFSATVVATHVTLRHGFGASSSGLTEGTGIAALVAFIGFAFGLWYTSNKPHSTWRGWSSLSALTVLLATAILACGAQVSSAPLVVHSCCTATMLGHRFLAVSIASLCGAAMIVARVASFYRTKLYKHRQRSRHDLEEAHARLQHIATHDPMTGLANRSLLKENLTKALSDTARPGRSVAIAVIDLDRFSAVNHSFGHGVGDHVLTEIAHRLESTVPHVHTLARVGDDSFAVLIDGVSARVQAQAITSAMLTALEQPLYLNGEDFRARVSIGVSLCPDDARRGDDLLAHAEAAMISAKRGGGGRVLFFESRMSDSMQERLALENDLRRALTANEFELHYQPQVSTASGSVMAVEALLRWRHPTKGFITPSSIIPLAEETGLIVPLNEWVLREACRRARAWISGQGLDLRVAVNLSAVHFRRNDVISTILSALHGACLDPRFLEIELTEGTLMTDPERSGELLKLLRTMGVSVAIDDFGTGYSSLSYLRRLPIDKLKIDRSFVRDLVINHTDESIVRAIVSLAHSVGLQVIAEGVETEQQLARISLLECDFWQGYYCCKPQPPECLTELLTQRRVCTSPAAHGQASARVR